MAGRQDYTGAKFRSLFRGPVPQPIKQMIERTFESFGTDTNAITKIWTRPLLVDRASDGMRRGWQGKLERDLFPHNSTDVCCADLASFVLYQTGVCNPLEGEDRKPWKGSGGIHWAPFYLPIAEKNGEYIRLIKKGTRITDFFKDASAREKLYDDWLPGDYLLYTLGVKVRGHAADDPSHINVYIGEFQEEVNGNLAGPVFELANASLGIGGNNAFVRPYELSSFRYWLNGGAVWHCRVLAIERLFAEMMGAPLRIAARPPEDRKGAAAVATLEPAWSDARDAGAPYPIGANRTWHGGIHLRSGVHLEGDEVLAFAPGEIVLARLAPRTSKFGDTSFLLVRHRLDPAKRRILAPDGAGDPGGPAPVSFYSLYMHLAPLSAYFDEQGNARPGNPEAGGAPPWLAKLAPRALPAYRKFIPNWAPRALFTWTRAASGELVPLRLDTKPGLIAQLDYPDYAGFEKVAYQGATHYVLPQSKEDTNLAAWSAKPPPPSVPARSLLHFYNPATGELIETRQRLERSVLLGVGEDALDVVRARDGSAVKAADGRVAVAIRQFDDPGFDLSRERKHLDWEETAPAKEGSDASGVLEFDAKAVTLYLDTTGSGARRAFADGRAIELPASKYTLRFEARRATTGATTQRDRAWPVLVPCTLLSETEISDHDKRLAELEKSFVGQVRARLESNPPTSCLFGVEVRERDGWKLEDGLLRPVDEESAGAKPLRLQLFPHVAGSGPQRLFPKRPPVRPGEDNLPEGDEPPVYEIEPDASVAIHPVELFRSGGRQRALVEVRFAVAESAITDNQADIDDARKRNAERSKLLGGLRSGAIVRLDDASGFKRADRSVGREPIARLGRIAPEAAGAASEARGMHFEIFSGANLVDPSVKGEQGKLAPVPQTRWQVLRDDGPEALTTAASFQRALDALLALPGIEGRALGARLPADARDARLPTPEEWIAFCAENQRVLSRVISVHAPEWKLDWARLLDAEGSRFRAMSPKSKQELREAFEAFRWWTPDLALEGIEGDAAFYYHPLRLIEWLNTGLDVSIAAADRAGVTVSVEGRSDQKLERSPSDGAFRYRTVLDSGRDTLPATLVLEGVPTANPRIKDRIVRGSVRRIGLAAPRVALSVEEPSTWVSYAIPVKQVGVSGLHLLADGNEHLANSGYSRANLRIDVSYNVKKPDRLKLELEPADAPFALEGWSLSGATAGGKAEGRVGGKSLELALDPDPAEAQEASARALSLRIEVAPGRRVGASAKLVATVSGGDLGAQPVIRKSDEIRTREIKDRPGPKDRGPGHAKGEDVAKIQLYLSQIHAFGLPCYRNAGGGAEYAHDKPSPIVIDGDYGESLARGLWRFIYYFADASDWQLGAVRAVKLDGKKTAEISIGRADLRPPADASDPRAKARDDRITRPAEFPIVDEGLLAEITRRFRAPLVLPAARFEVTETPLGKTPHFPIDAKPGWNGSVTGRSTILPEDDAIEVLLICPEIAKVQGDVPVRLELPESSAYRIWEGGSARTSVDTNLRAAVRAWTLVPSGTLSTKPAENTLAVVTASGSVLGRIELAGARDLTKKQGDSCRDVALLQLWLSQIVDSGSTKQVEPLYKRAVKVKKDVRYAVDGKWSNDLVKALDLFKERITRSTPDSLGRLVAQVREHYRKVAP